MTSKTQAFKPARDLPSTRESKQRLKAIKKAAVKRDITQAQLVRRGLIMAAPELEPVFTRDLL
jgi:hypothetical protein